MNVGGNITHLLSHFIAIAFSLLLALPSFAQSSENQQIVFEGSLTDSGGNPIDLSGASLVFYISANGCYLYGESTAVAGDSQGNINHRIGSSSLIPGSPNGFTQNLFFGFVSGTTTFAGNDCSVTPSDTRLAQVYYAAESLTASIKLGTVPYAHNATMLNGKVAADFIEASNDSVMIFYGGSNGQILSKSASGLTWVNPSAPAVTSSSITTALGYTPANKSNNLSDLTSATAARANLGLGIIATKNSVNLATTDVTGILSASSLPSFSGDVSTTAGSSTTTLQKIRGIALSATAPVSGQILYYDGSSWGPMTVSAPSSDSKWVTGVGGIYTTSNTTVGSSTTYSNVGLTAFAPASVSNSIIASFNNTNSDGFGLKVNVDNSSPSQYGLKVSSYGATTFVVRNDGNIGIGLGSPTARLHLAAGTSALAPLRVSSGTLQSTPTAGAIEYDGSRLYLTNQANLRQTIPMGNNANSIDNITHFNSPADINLVPNTGNAVRVAGSFIVSSTINNEIARFESPNNQYMTFVKGGGEVANLGLGTAGFMGANTITDAMVLNAVNGVQLGTGTGAHLTVTPSGQVGIGTTTPTTALTVNGSIRTTAGGYEYADGTSQTTSAFGGYERISAACTLTASCSATCSAGKKIIGGGCDAGASASNLKSSYPLNDNQWQCNWTSSITAGAVWAICTKM